MVLPKFFAEGLDVLSTFVLAVDHYAVCSCFDVGVCSFDCIVKPFACYEALDPCDDHEVRGNLGLLAGTYLLAEMLDGVLGLDGVSAEEGVFLEADLVFDYDRRDTESFKCPHGKHEVLDLAACVAVEDDRLCSAFQGIVEVMETGREVNRFDIRLPLARGVGKGA